MLGTIEELERDIEQFQSNVAASNELYTLLGQMLDQIKQQNSSFGSKSDNLLRQLDGIPASLDAANAASNAAVKKDLSTEIDRAIHGFSREQDKYVQLLEQMQQQIQLYIEESKSHAASFEDRTTLLIAKVGAVPEQIKEDTCTSLENHRSAIDANIEKRNAQFSKVQQRYISTLEETSGKIKHCEDLLLSRYQEFLQTLEQTNLLNLYEQNKKMQAELNKRTTILMVIAGVSVVLGIVGLIL